MADPTLKDNTYFSITPPYYTSIIYFFRFILFILKTRSHYVALTILKLTM